MDPVHVGHHLDGNVVRQPGDSNCMFHLSCWWVHSSWALYRRTLGYIYLEIYVWHCAIHLDTSRYASMGGGSSRSLVLSACFLCFKPYSGSSGMKWVGTFASSLAGSSHDDFILHQIFQPTSLLIRQIPIIDSTYFVTAFDAIFKPWSCAIGYSCEKTKNWLQIHFRDSS